MVTDTRPQKILVIFLFFLATYLQKYFLFLRAVLTCSKSINPDGCLKLNIFIYVNNSIISHVNSIQTGRFNKATSPIIT